MIVPRVLRTWDLWWPANAQSERQRRDLPYAGGVPGGLLQAGVSLLALWYHYLAGLRHLYWDAGHGLDIETAEMLGWAYARSVAWAERRRRAWL